MVRRRALARGDFLLVEPHLLQLPPAGEAIPRLALVLAVSVLGEQHHHLQIHLRRAVVALAVADFRWAAALPPPPRRKSVAVARQVPREGMARLALAPVVSVLGEQLHLHQVVVHFRLAALPPPPPTHPPNQSEAVTRMLAKRQRHLGEVLILVRLLPRLPRPRQHRRLDLPLAGGPHRATRRRKNRQAMQQQVREHFRSVLRRIRVEEHPYPDLHLVHHHPAAILLPRHQLRKRQMEPQSHQARSPCFLSAKELHRCPCPLEMVLRPLLLDLCLPLEVVLRRQSLRIAPLRRQLLHHYSEHLLSRLQHRRQQ
mmetsp:Transcript_25756/g.46466  ORF Transcript_25756/g.46466 Transcript_25756/m.46466 type:complete len:313 (-) Transcript_25756:908-1846(-)